ncbi:MAG: GlmU family protein [Bacteroidales bacterium]|nr:GlmU family protein [Bacteroidales bacterium]
MQTRIVLFDGKERLHLLPLTFTRPVSFLRVGILTIYERWCKILPNITIEVLSPIYLRELYPISMEHGDCILVNGSYLPDIQLAEKIVQLGHDDVLLDENQNLIAFVQELGKINLNFNDYFDPQPFIPKFSKKNITRADKINYSWDIFSKADVGIRFDFNLITRGRTSAHLSAGNKSLNEKNIFIEEGARVEFSILNASTGPIYIGKDAEVMENCSIRGPFALGEHGVLKMGAKIYGPTSLGPYCKVGGEVNNSVFLGFSNKAHDGFIGNAVIGEWCNIGADSNNSNLKNTYDEVKLWSYVEKSFIRTGLQFCGLIMGDHTKCSINTMFNTGTVIGVSCNLYGSGFHKNFIPSFTWGEPGKYIVYQLEKAFLSIERMKERRGLSLSETEKKVLTHIFDLERNERK